MAFAFGYTESVLTSILDFKHVRRSAVDMQLVTSRDSRIKQVDTPTHSDSGQDQLIEGEEEIQGSTPAHTMPIEIPPATEVGWDNWGSQSVKRKAKAKH